MLTQVISKLTAEELSDNRIKIDREIKLNELKNKLVLVPRPQSWTSQKLLESVFPKVKWAVPGIIPSGLTVLAGAPKVGKSWLTLQIGAALSTGENVLGNIVVEKTGVLYLSLEDTPRRLKERLEKIQAYPSENFHFRTDWSRMTQGLFMLEEFLIEHPTVSVIIIDTLAKIKPVRDSNYSNDYDDAGNLKQLAELYDVSIILVHHTRKAYDDDWINMISGSTGITGAADTLCGLFRSRGQADAVLHITGRDVDEQEIALQFEKPTGIWTIMGDAAQFNLTKQRLEVLEVIQNSKVPISPKDVAKQLSKENGSVRRLIVKLFNEGFLEKEAYGKYIFVDRDGNSGNSGNTLTEE